MQIATMTRKKQVRDETFKLLTQNGLEGWKVRFNPRLTRALGRCIPSQKTIEYQPRYMQQNGWEQVLTTIQHEVAHAISCTRYGRLGESEWNYLNRDNAAKVAAILMAENVRSVNAKYNENGSNPYVFKYDPTAHNRPVGNIIGALECYEYQACETDDWHTSLAHEIVGGLRKHLLKVIAEKEGTYTWGIK